VARIVVLGGGVCGLSGALMLARDGHDVSVLEQDPAAVPDSPLESWEEWERGGVAQFRQPHYLQPRGRLVLDAELPDVRDALLAAGGLRFDPLKLMPPWIADRAPRPGDERFETITARRATIEQVVARVAQDEPALDVRRGVTVRELLVAPGDGTPHVSGVRTESGEELEADLVVDAMGRRSQLPRWLAAAGADPLHEEAEDSGFIYYTRYFRGELPQVRGPLITPYGSITLLTLLADNGTWSVTVYISAGDQPLKRVREPGAWTTVVQALPEHAHWLEGEPISDVAAMGGVLDRYRRLVVDGRPVATGLALVADSCACTNPSLGRGIALGLVQAQALRDVVRSDLGGDPLAFAHAWDAATEAQIVPWYRAGVLEDRARLRQIDALRRGEPVPAPAGVAATAFAALPVAAVQDADLFRVMLDTRCCLGSPTALLETPGLTERVLELAAAHPATPPPGPDREQLLALLA